MQVSAHTWQTPTDHRRKPLASATPIYSMPIERVDDRPARQRGGSPGGGRKPPADDTEPKTAHKQVFMARSLSSTLTALELASLAEGTALRPASATLGSASPNDLPRPEVGLGDDAGRDPPAASLDDLLSSLLSAA